MLVVLASDMWSFGIVYSDIIADLLLNACKDIGLAVNTGKIEYMEMGRNRGMIANEHIMIGSNSILLNIMFLHRWEDFS